jgi:hypothetical protein
VCCFCSRGEETVVRRTFSYLISQLALENGCCPTVTRCLTPRIIYDATELTDPYAVTANSTDKYNRYNSAFKADRHRSRAPPHCEAGAMIGRCRTQSHAQCRVQPSCPAHIKKNHSTRPAPARLGEKVYVHSVVLIAVTANSSYQRRQHNRGVSKDSKANRHRSRSTATPRRRAKMGRSQDTRAMSSSTHPAPSAQTPHQGTTMLRLLRRVPFQWGVSLRSGARKRTKTPTTFFVTV